MYRGWRLSRYPYTMVLRKHTRPVPPLDGSTLVHAGGTLFVDTVTGMVLSRVGDTSTNGYERVTVDGRSVAAHRVVYEAVHGPIPPGLSINHLDGVKLNNRPDNLEAATQSRQMAHAYSLGLRSGNGLTGTTRPSRLSAEQVQRLMDAPKGTVTGLAREFGIAPSYAYQIRAKRRLAQPRH